MGNAESIKPQTLALRYRLHYYLIEKAKSNFHKQVLESWIKLKIHMPVGGIEILNKYIFKSKLFTCESSMLKPSFFLTDK